MLTVTYYKTTSATGLPEWRVYVAGTLMTTVPTLAAAMAVKTKLQAKLHQLRGVA